MEHVAVGRCAGGEVTGLGLPDTLCFLDPAVSTRYPKHAPIERCTLVRPLDPVSPHREPV